MMAADMIEMAVAGDAEERLLRLQRNMPVEANNAQAGIEQQIALAAAHMPHVAADIRNDMGREDQCNIVTVRAYLEPVFGDGQWHGEILT